MKDVILVCFSIIVVLTVFYFLCLGFFNVIKKLAEGGQGALKGICILMALIGIGYVLCNQDQCSKIIERVKHFTISDYFKDEKADEPVVHDFFK